MESAQHPHGNILGSLCPDRVPLYQLQLIVRHGLGPEMPTVGTVSFAEPAGTAPMVCLFMCWERLCRSLGRVSTYGGFCKHPLSYRLPHRWHVILAIKQFKVKCQEKGRATITHHPNKCYNLLLSQKLICSF